MRGASRSPLYIDSGRHQCNCFITTMGKEAVHIKSVCFVQVAILCSVFTTHATIFISLIMYTKWTITCCGRAYQLPSYMVHNYYSYNHRIPSECLKICLLTIKIVRELKIYMFNYAIAKRSKVVCHNSTKIVLSLFVFQLHAHCSHTFDDQSSEVTMNALISAPIKCKQSL